MKKSHITLLSLFSLVTLPILATDPPIQKKELGEVRLSAGVGGATPWDASIRYNFGNTKFRISPFFGLKGINNHSSGTEEDIQLTYTGRAPFSTAESKGYQYLSQDEKHSKGSVLNFGANMGLKLSKADQVELGLKHVQTHLHTLGSRSETVNSPLGVSPVLNGLVPSSMDGTDNLNTLEVTAGYTHSFEGSNWFLLGGKFDLRYSYLREEEEQDHLLVILPGASYPVKDDYQCFTWGISQKHRLQADLLTPYITFVPIHIGAFCENRLLMSDDQQWMEEVMELDDHFEHRYQTVGAYLKADWTVSKLKFNAKLEYDYTHMQKYVKEPSKAQNLNDFVPEAGVLWSMNKHNTLQFNYVRRIIRPSLELLNPAAILGPFTRHFGNPDLIGAHINNLSLRYMLKRDKVDFTTTVQHIRANDGFCAIWTEKNLQRNYTWLNVGKRRAWSVTPEVVWCPATQTQLQAKATLMWDKREAESIHTSKEHWGITTSARLTQQLPAQLRLGLNCSYSEGNTLDLYSHEGRAINYGADLSRNFLHNKLEAKLSYLNRETPKVILTQGAYTGFIDGRPAYRHQVELSLGYKF